MSERERMKPLLSIEDISKDFEKESQTIHALRGIVLQISKGESLSITGPSGAGKSTLLNIMGTLEPPSRGRILFEGRDIYEMDETGVNGIRNREIGFVFQFHHLLYEFNAIENAMVPALISGCGKSEAGEMASDILERMGLGDRLFHRVGELSGGEQQRVAIARALIMGPKLLLADEPTGNLDKTTGEEITDLLLDLNKDTGLALVIATHNLELASSMTQQLHLVDGRFT
jgi:lipoprotein-releasing system ATP-binding protein